MLLRERCRRGGGCVSKDRRGRSVNAREQHPQPVEHGTAQLAVGPQARLKRGAACWYWPAAGRAQSRKGGAKKHPSAREGASDGQCLAFSSRPPTTRPPRDKASRYGVLEVET